MEISRRNDRIRKTVSICISIAALVLCAFYVFDAASLAHLNLDKKALGFLVIALLPWMVDRVESFKGFGVEIKRKLDAQSVLIAQQQELLNLMFWFSMEADMFDTLKSLVYEDPFTHNPNDQINYPIVNGQLKELFNRGYIDRDPAAIEQNENIGRGHIVTDLGKRFVYERKTLEAEGAMKKLQELSPLTPVARG